MTNQEIKKHKGELVTITRGLNIAENDSLEQRLKNLYEGIKKLQKLADVVGACKYYGTALRDIDQLLSVVEGERPNAYRIDFLKQKYAACEDIYKEIYRNMHYTLQTEEMFNACVFAKWSCFWAFLASTVACIGVILTMFLN